MKKKEERQGRRAENEDIVWEIHHHVNALLPKCKQKESS